jgi:hypothetical protein
MKGRNYMLAYIHFEQFKDTPSDQLSAEDRQSFKAIEKFQKTCKVHRCTSDQDSGWLAKIAASWRVSLHLDSQ